MTVELIHALRMVKLEIKMANWYGAARTNYVTVLDMTKVVEITAPFGIEISDAGLSGKYAFFPDPCSDGDFNYYVMDDDGDEIEFSWEDIMPYVEEGEVLVVMCSGAEKLRFITGGASAYCRKGDKIMSTEICLNDIYKKAAFEFDVELISMSVAEY